MIFQFTEGATPLPDCSGLLLPWVQTMSDLNRVEAENISPAQRKYLRPSSRDISSWFHYQEFQTIHRSMFDKVWEWAGKQRKSKTSIGVEPGLIPARIAELCAQVASWSTDPVELTFLEKSARIHHSLVHIHLFENGNGRFSRLVADRCLLSWKCPHPIWPDNLNFEGAARKLYIQTLKAADKGDYEPLVSLMKDLGAADPDLSILFQDRFYRPYIEGPKGLAKVRALLRKGEKPTPTLANRHHPLQLIIRATLESRRKLEFLKLLVKEGAEVNVVDKSGLTPFQVAVDVGDKEIAIFLRSKGARPLAPPGTGYTKYYNLFFQLPPN